MALQEMVCLTDEGTVTCIIRDTIGGGPKKQSMLQCAPSHSVANVFINIGNDFHYEPDTFELLLQNKSEMVVLNQHKDKTLGEAGMCFDQDTRNTIIISALKNSPQRNMTLVVTECGTDDDLLLGASASPTASSTVGQGVPSFLLSGCKYGGSDNNHYSLGYVGLVNQAMTCYLNSLLQALFMTPEFRNALYKWEFDNGCKENISIPFQLQKLFLNLQTSTKSAVETTDLTKSFGWDMSEAWQQHDIQELCRVMFDALEQKFKDTKQADLINNLYEGKMLDYVKCLECCTDKSREDTFLDIPLPVRPFGSTVAYNSVEEALRAFVQPETLDGNNQYHCEKCGKKCDAHKGLKFIKFPYLLTLHLKRFDFDYNTMHRIKLNDKVVFPEKLNLNGFILSDANDKSETVEETVKCDDSSTTDSGSALDDESCPGADISPANGQTENSQECPDDDEGIDMSNENERKGPYVYELFSIMIHSGSASGGHYYAYIKDFQKNQWFCFNDQIVTRITDDDIRKTYGGGPQRGYYSGAYSSSTNAYMLMYRQIDSERNCNYISVEEFPPHITKLLKQMHEQEESDRVEREKEIDRCKLKIYLNHPRQNQLLDAKLFVFPDTTLDEVTKEAFGRFKLDGIVAIEDCRLVSYNKSQDTIESSYDTNDVTLGDILRGNSLRTEWLLEIRPYNMEWQCYKPGGVNMKVFTICLDKEEVEGPISVRVNPGDTVKDLKQSLAKILKTDESQKTVLIQENYNGETEHLEVDSEPVKFDINCSAHKLYVADGLDEDPDKPFIISRLHKVIDRFVHIVTLDILLPDVDVGTLEKFSIPALNSCPAPVPMEQDGSENSSPSPPVVNMRVSPQPMAEGAFSDQSNSEDSSLSDSDRTLIGDAPCTAEALAQLSSCSNSPADPTQDPYNHEIFGNLPEEHWDEDEEAPAVHHRSINFYFKSTPISVCSMDGYVDPDASRSCRVLVDKRMNLANLKKNLECLVGVPVEYFKIYRQYTHQDMEWSRLSDTLSSTKDGERLMIKLGRVLKKDEYSGKVYQLTPGGPEAFKFLFEWVIAKGSTVAIVKKEILTACKKQLMMDICYTKCRLRKKNWKNPSRVYLDEQKFGDDLTIANNWELFLQELPDGEKATSTDQLTLFVRRWCPSTMELRPFQEVVLDNPQMEELKEKVSELSEIPVEFVEITEVTIKSSFPCDMNVLDIHNDLEWYPGATRLDKWKLHGTDDGAVFFYRDQREELKELTLEERKELNAKESARLGKYDTRSYSYTRKERALKIYLHTSPNKSEEAGD